MLTLLLAFCCSIGPSESLGTLLGDYHCGDTLAIVYHCVYRDADTPISIQRQASGGLPFATVAPQKDRQGVGEAR